MSLLHLLSQISELNCDRSLQIDYARYSIESYIKDRFPSITIDFSRFSAAVVKEYFDEVRPSFLALASTQFLKQQSADLLAAGESSAAMRLELAIKAIQRDCQSSIERFRAMTICKFNEYLRHNSAVSQFATELAEIANNQPPCCRTSAPNTETETHRAAFMAVLAEQ